MHGKWSFLLVASMTFLLGGVVFMVIGNSSVVTALAPEMFSITNQDGSRATNVGPAGRLMINTWIANPGDLRGPAGPEGQIGPQGPAGDAGPPGEPSPSTQAFLDRFGNSLTSAGNPSAGCADKFIGEVWLFAGNFEPRGTLFAHGQLLSISSFTSLFSLVGTIYGGDGRTTFALPDMSGLEPQGVSYVICLSGIFPSRN